MYVYIIESQIRFNKSLEADEAVYNYGTSFHINNSTVDEVFEEKKSNESEKLWRKFAARERDTRHKVDKLFELPATNYNLTGNQKKSREIKAQGTANDVAEQYNKSLSDRFNSVLALSGAFSFDLPISSSQGISSNTSNEFESKESLQNCCFEDNLNFWLIINGCLEYHSAHYNI